MTMGKLDAAADRRHQQMLSEPPLASRAARAQLVSLGLRKGRRGGALRRILAAMRGPGRLTLDEIIYYRLLDEDLPDDAVGRFVGKRRQKEFHSRCNSHFWAATAVDKVLFYTVMAGARLPVPETVAVFGVERAGIPRIMPGGLGDFLRGAAEWPLFAKPIGGTYSIGAIRLARIEGDAVTVDDVGPVPVDALERYMTDMSDRGYLLQRCMQPSAFTAEHLLGGLSSIRAVVLISGSEITVESAVLKIAGRGSTADNYWRPGNAVAAIELGTGRLARVVTGTGAGMRVLDAHPETGRPLAGLTIPDWPAILDLVRTAASMFPPIRTQSWDIALTDAGPRLLELNNKGDLNLIQLAHRRGALTPSYCEHLRRCGWKRALPG